MHFPKPFLLLLILFFTHSLLPAQVQIPGFTGYALPAETMNEDDAGTGMFSEQAGLHGWTAKTTQIQYFFNAADTGRLTIHLLLKTERPGNKLRISVAGKSFYVQVPAAKKFTRVFAGTVPLAKPGFYTINIAAVQQAGKTIADIQSIELSGKAAPGLRFNAKPRRNAPSVHLKYPLPDTSKAVMFYTELTVPDSADKLYSYYMANGFARGYFGIQVNSLTERRVIFSVWDAGSEAADRNKVADDNKVQLLAKGSGVVAEGFGNEGTGGHSHWGYNWKAGTTYSFLVTALPDSAGNSTFYTGYFFIPELQQWKLIAAFKAPKDGQYLHGLYSFAENFIGSNGQQQRKAFFGNQWVRNENGAWHEITRASFSYDATGKAGDRTDYGGGTENGRFYLWNGGFQPATASYGQVFTRSNTARPPTIDLYKNADSAAQAAIDRVAMSSAISAGTADSMRSINGVYYRIVKEGSGAPVLVTDTVVAYYKGALLSGGVFDETKDKPATFPLNRLIKGWQIGLPMCKTGGKIRLVIPSALAYSLRMRSPKIPPNSVLVFDIEVVESRHAKAL